MKPYRQFTHKDIVIKVHRLVFLIPGLDPLSVLERFFSLVPQKSYGDFLEKILIGHFPELAKSKKTAGYKNGTVFVSSFLEEGNYEKKYGKQNPGAELLKNLVHETGHVFEENFRDMLFLDGAIQDELTSARQLAYGSFGQKYSGDDVESWIDGVGFNELRAKTIGRLPNPNSILNQEEFIAYCFEEFFLRDRTLVSKLSPTVFSILSEVTRDHE